MKKFLALFLAFARVGVMTFGGGYAMIPILEREIVDKHGWATSEELMDYYAVGQCTPGVIAVNTATFIGQKLYGTLGGIVATLGVVFPSVLIISVIAGILTNFADIPAVQHAFAGIRAGVLALLVKALWSMYQKSPKGWPSYVVMAGAFILTAVFDFNVIFVIIGCGVFGLVTSLCLEMRNGK